MICDVQSTLCIVQSVCNIVVLYYQWDGCANVKSAEEQSGVVSSLKLGDTDLRAAALQEMKHNNTMLQIGKKKKSLVEKG